MSANQEEWEKKYEVRRRKLDAEHELRLRVIDARAEKHLALMLRQTKALERIAKAMASTVRIESGGL